MSLIDRIKKNSTIKESSVLDSSSFFKDKEDVKLPVPAMNIAFAGDVDKGYRPGLTVWAGASKSFKTMFLLMSAKCYLDKYPDAIVLFYDSEFGANESYFESLGIDTSRVVHVPLMNIEQMKFDVVQQLEKLEKGDRVFFAIDSVGNIASKKEVEDAMNEKSAADMTRAKQLKSFFRMVTPYLTMKNVPMHVVNHIYMEQCLAGDTLIRTEEGDKPISDIQVGDMVYALDGKLQKVLHKYNPEDLNPIGKKFLELEFDDGHKVRCTHDHKFLTEDGEWVEAIDLKMGQLMC